MMREPTDGGPEVAVFAAECCAIARRELPRAYYCAVMLRAQGATLQEVADEMGLSPERARQLVLCAASYMRERVYPRGTSAWPYRGWRHKYLVNRKPYDGEAIRRSGGVM